ncbi:DNA internalization-related competence protein ComEC/Rec2 [Methylovorus sp. MP688]|uniref:DNA internalization-related competence protein ComEC/Rec2 n=1 Tax=Methylovorus sp. (strain MP688) TaxID=887061 RepID=UPI00059D9976|nr:DNA internalization-related competence protein ComEC/Rec2 [Methylovorus sp. MP688]
MITLALAFTAGAWVLQQLPSLPALWPVGLLLILLTGLCWYLPAHMRRVFLCLLAVVCGFAWAAWLAQARLADALSPEWEGRDIAVVGVVAGLPEQRERGVSFAFDVEQVLTPTARVPNRISLNLYRHNAFGSRDSGTGESASPAEKQAAIPQIHAGERWQLTVRLKRPHGSVNPHGFDFERWALENDLQAFGYIRTRSEYRRVDDMVWRPAYVVERVREHLNARIAQVLPGRPAMPLLQALVTGDDSGITTADWDVFLRSGVNHLISISGLHITMLASLAYWAVYAGWRRSYRLNLLLPARKAGVILGWLVALLYSLVAGFSVPTQRTLYMLTVFAIALWLGRRFGIARVLACALLVVVLIDPWAVMAPGFWLSFGAVAVMAFAGAYRIGMLAKWRQAVHAQWAVTLGLLPLLLLLFQQVSLVSPLANAIAIPVVSLGVVPLALAGTLLPIDSLLWLAHALMQFVTQAMHWLAVSRWAVWQQQAPPAWSLLPAMAGIFWMLLPRGFPLRWLGWMGLLPMLLIRQEPLPDGAMRVVMLDVGQGMAVVVHTARHTLLYDTGPRYSAESDAGRRVILPYLRGEGIVRLDGLIVSHNDNDHSGGLQAVADVLSPQWMLSSLPAEAVPLQVKQHRTCQAGQRWQWDGVVFEMLYPDVTSMEQVDLQDNNRSCVVKVSSRYGSILLAGDIEKSAEARLLEAAGGRVAADALLVPHHGSRTSSTPAFVAAVRPAIALYAVGYRNRFGHPKAEVMARYHGLGAQDYRSDRDGAILLDFLSVEGIAVHSWRQQSMRYWYARD